MIQAVKDRLEAGISALNGRVRGGGDLASIMARNSRPSAPVFAYVLYGGVQPTGKPDVITGLYSQPVREVVTVLLLLRADDQDGERAIEDVQQLQMQILNLLCGWAPGNQIGVFQLARSASSLFRKGVVGWQIDLTINDQLRITS